MDEPKVLVVDDDEDILEFVSYNLKSSGFKVETSKYPEKVIKKALQFKPNLIILDVMMPNIDGIELCEKIRATNEIKDVLITFLTARAEDYSQIAGYDAGADDYITKPIKPKVLVSKVKALLKRQGVFDEVVSDSNKIYEGPQIVNGITIDKERYIVTKDEFEYILPKKEFELLSLLASHPDKVFLRDEIYNQVWGEQSFVGDRTIDVHIRKLRKKFGDNIIRTVKGVGYKFTE
ncbi:MAG: response regulator transcription factor [Bacteroidales bacterium]|nr:response regulator transcription factor [Bacteroidales bacterium]